jgi:peptidoglycan/LPS O-acetylase OafA/YrhL
VLCTGAVLPCRLLSDLLRRCVFANPLLQWVGRSTYTLFLLHYPLLLQLFHNFHTRPGLGAQGFRLCASIVLTVVMAAAMEG